MLVHNPNEYSLQMSDQMIFSTPGFSLVVSTFLLDIF